MATIHEVQRPCTRQLSHRDGLGSTEKLVNLQPFKRKLDRVETERIYRTIQSTLKNLNQAQVLLWLIEDDAHLFRITDPELRELVIRHQYISKNVDDIEFDKESLTISTTTILRYCTQNRVLLSSFKPSAGLEQITEVENISSYFEEMREVMLERLLTEREEETLRWQYLLLTMEKARHAQNAIVHLQKSLNEKVKEKDMIIAAKEKEILQLQQRLEGIKATVDEQNNTTLNDAAKQILSNQMSLQNKNQKHKVESLSLKDKARKTRIVDYDQESKLRKRKFKLAGELFNWILKYDQDMGWRQDQIDELRQLNQRDLVDIKELESHFVDLQKEYDVIVEERRVIAEEKKQKEKEERERKRASIKIQALWRGYETRKSLKQNGGKKKGGKKKGGNKKKAGKK